MTPCAHTDEIEALALGSLDARRAAAAEAHAAGCAACAAELRATRAERAVFARRASGPARGGSPPAFARVLGAIDRAEAATRTARMIPRALIAAFAVAACAAGLFAAARALGPAREHLAADRAATSPSDPEGPARALDQGAGDGASCTLDPSLADRVCAAPAAPLASYASLTPSAAGAARSTWGGTCEPEATCSVAGP